MPKVVWDATGSRLFETGIDRCVLYVPGFNNVFYGDYAKGFAWNGVTSIEETGSSPSVTPYYFNGKLYYKEIGTKEFGAKLTAYTYPDEFIPFDGYDVLTPGFYADEQPDRGGVFHLTYRTLIGNDQVNDKLGYKIHFLYNLQAVPSSKSHQSKSGSISMEDFSWDLTGTPVELESIFAGSANAVHLVVDSRKIPTNALKAIENDIYGTLSGTDGATPRMISPQSIARYIFMVKDNGDGTARIDGDDSYVNVSGWPNPSDYSIYTINYPGVVAQDDGETVTISDTY